MILLNFSLCFKSVVFNLAKKAKGKKAKNPPGDSPGGFFAFSLGVVKTEVKTKLSFIKKVVLSISY